MFRRFVLLVPVALAGCINTGDQANISAADSSLQQAERWSGQDAPGLFSATLNYKFADLPLDGEAARIPWAGSYWPVSRDGINDRWDAASDPPSTKYGRAFNVSGVEDAVSRANGVDSQRNRTKCTEATAASVCKSNMGEECAIRAGQTEGRCIPTWFGICHAWAPAAILMPEPKFPVTRNGVTFQVNDLKALASLVHEGVETRFVSLRCDLDDNGTAIKFDEQGRPVVSACRDSNAGSFHVLISNYLGLQGQSFVFDRTYDDEVWNQPLRGYNVLQNREVDVNEAHRLLGVSGTFTTYKFNDQAKKLRYVQVDVSYISESESSTDGNLAGRIDEFTASDRYEYILEMDAAGVINGGEWIGSSKRLHPDFAWLPVRAREGNVAGGKISYANVKSLVDESQVGSGSGGTTQARTDAKFGTVLADVWMQFGPYDTAPNTTFTVKMTGTGDADLYVRRGSAPTFELADCSSYGETSVEECIIPGGGQVFVGVYGYADTNTYNLNVSWSSLR
jgi:Transglutaminase elicitor